MDPNSPQVAPEPDTTPPHQPVDNSIYGQPYNSGGNKGSNKKHTVIIVIVASIFALLVMGVLAAMVVTAYSGIKQRAEKNVQVAKQQQNNELVTQTVTMGGKSVSVLVPKSWKDISETLDTEPIEGQKTFNPDISSDEIKRITLEIKPGQDNLSAFSEEDFQKLKTSFSESDQAYFTEEQKDDAKKVGYTTERTDYTGLEGHDFGFIYKYSYSDTDKDTHKTTQYSGQKISIYRADGTYVKFEILNSEPNKLSDVTIEKIVKSLKFN
ncbi:MAG: hypothetical protein Q7T74_07490 [Candidatus Saccharibacteria bacterium]|nr:hypothetical protein [Candidatus Saccharibacteria bacterium]